MNRSVSNVLFSNWAALGSGEAQAVTGSLSRWSRRTPHSNGVCVEVIIVPGYGMAVAQAQHKIWR